MVVQQLKGRVNRGAKWVFSPNEVDVVIYSKYIVWSPSPNF